MDAFADLDRRLRRVREIPVAAILHPDLHLVARRLAHRMLYTIAREPATNCASNRCQNSTTPPTDLISQQPAGDSAAYGSETRRRLGFLDCVDGDNLPGIRVNCYWPWSGLSLTLIGIVVRIPRSLLNRSATVMTDARLGWRVLRRALFNVRLRRSDRRAGDWGGGRYSLRRRRRHRAGRWKKSGHRRDTRGAGQDDRHGRARDQRVNATALR